MIRLTCDHCGVDQPDATFLYCVNCGQQLETPTRVVPKPSAVENRSNDPKKRRTAFDLIGRVALLLFAACGVALAVIWLTSVVRNREPLAPSVSDGNSENFVYPTIPAGPSASNRPTTTTPVNPRPTIVPSIEKHEPTTAPAEDDTALCNDGTYTKWLVTSKACSANGGVKQWRVSGIDPTKRARAICGDGHISYYDGPRLLVCATGRGVRHWYY